MELTPPLTRDTSPLKDVRVSQQLALGHARQARKDWQRLRNLQNKPTCIIDGNSLDIADVVGVAKYGAIASLSNDPEIRARIDKSIETLNRHLRDGHLVYGVTTGFGGSADTRTTDTGALQQALIQHQSSGVLASKDIGHEQNSGPTASSSRYEDFESNFDTQSMPTTWVRASMLIRCNSVVRGHSAVRDIIAETILALLYHEITPIVPLRGSISASGDLSPLSYIAGAIEGNPDVYCRIGRDTERIITADQALKEFNIEPVILRAKEGLGLLNGTAFSAGTATIAIYQTQQIAVLSQVLTAMGVEALRGTAESFIPRIAEMRPHRGQIEAAANIFSFLRGSKLAASIDRAKDTKMDGLYQDRYALRTSSQWIGPQLEDLHHAHEQLLVEINSTTDNPLIDSETDEILHGGNFQAAVVTSTMDRTRLALDKFGRLLFAQATEMIDPSLNKGLPANLAADDPSLSFTCKGIDINMASYASELSFLANPVGNHVMSAEMHNQAINSLALISSRYTLQALDTLRLLCSAYLFAVCQALDLRVLQIGFLQAMQPQLTAHLQTHLPDLSPHSSRELAERVWQAFTISWPTTTSLDLSERGTVISQSLLPALINHFTTLSEPQSPIPSLTTLTTLATTLAPLITKTYLSTSDSLFTNHLTIVPSYLGVASRAVYTFIRSPAPAGLGISIHQGLCEHPLRPKPAGWTQKQADERKTIGSRVSVIYEAMRDGRIDDIVMGIVG